MTIIDNVNTDIQDNDEMDEDDNDWETQQIRKAVTGSQLAAVQQESCLSLYGNGLPIGAVSQEHNMTAMIEQKGRITNVLQNVASSMNPNEIVKKTQDMYVKLYYYEH